MVCATAGRSSRHEKLTHHRNVDNRRTGRRFCSDMSKDDANDIGPRDSHDQLLDYRPIRWLLLTGSRRSPTLLLSVLVLGVLLAVGTVWEIEMERLVNETRAVQSLFNTLLGGIILFVSVVLSINIAVLAQELGPLQTKSRNSRTRSSSRPNWRRSSNPA